MVLIVFGGESGGDVVGGDVPVMVSRDGGGVEASVQVRDGGIR